MSLCWHKVCFRKSPMTNKPDSFFVQKTTTRPVGISGVGIHTGSDVRLELHPAPANTGIRFRRIDCGIEILALASHVSSLEWATTLGCDDVQISTVERAGLPTLLGGQKVEYEVVEDQRGRLAADNLKLVE